MRRGFAPGGRAGGPRHSFIAIWTMVSCPFLYSPKYCFVPIFLELSVSQTLFFGEVVRGGAARPRKSVKVHQHSALCGTWRLLMKEHNCIYSQSGCNAGCYKVCYNAGIVLPPEGPLHATTQGTSFQDLWGESAFSKDNLEISTVLLPGLSEGNLLLYGPLTPAHPHTCTSSPRQAQQRVDIHDWALSSTASHSICACPGGLRRG